MPQNVCIHPTAVVSPSAQIADGVEIGPYSVIGADVKIGHDTKIFSHVVVDGTTTIGERCFVYPGACLGFPGQDRKSKSQNSFLEIGNDNVIREYVTVHGSEKENTRTKIGDRNYLMANAHVAHDCVLGNDVTLANLVALSGHVQVADFAFLSGYVGVHQFVRIGKLAIVGALSKVVMDVAPFSIYDGHPAKFQGLNSIGLRRAGYTSAQAMKIKKALKLLFVSQDLRQEALDQLKKENKSDPDIQYLVRFAEESQRGVARA